MHISFSYAKILGEKLFRTREIPRNGSKAEDGEKKKEKKRDRTMVITMAKLRKAHASTNGTRKPPEPIHFIEGHIILIGCSGWFLGNEN